MAYGSINLTTEDLLHFIPLPYSRTATDSAPKSHFNRLVAVRAIEPLIFKEKHPLFRIYYGGIESSIHIIAVL